MAIRRCQDPLGTPLHLLHLRSNRMHRWSARNRQGSFPFFPSFTTVINKTLSTQSIPSYVRFYRDYSIADFSFCAFSAALATYGAFNSTARAGVCEEFSHHPELMRDMVEMGLNLENCERWLERAVLAAVAVLFIVMVIRVRHTLSHPFPPLTLFLSLQLHFLLAVSNFYSHLTRHHHARTSSRSISCPAGSQATSTSQRIFLLPQHNKSQEPSSEVVYAPVPLNSLPKEMQMQAMEAWVQQQPEDGQGSERPRHHHHHHHSHSHHHRRHSRSSSADTLTGTIRLDIKPDEGLLPVYDSRDGEDIERGKA